MKADNKNKIAIRCLKEADLPRAAELWLACFPEDDADFVDYYFTRRTRPRNMLGLFEDGLLVSMLSFEKTELFTGDGGSVPACFVAGVCTDPEKRRRGFVRKLFAVLEKRLKARGVAAVLLVPFDFGFYEKLGYVRYAVQELAEYPSAAEHTDFEEAPASRELLERVYAAYMNGREGALKRSASFFAALEAEYSLPGACSAAVRTDKGEAYCLFWSGSDGCADEFAFTDEGAAAALASLLKARYGVKLLPLPARDGGESFNMIKLLDPAYSYLLEPGRKPFDFRKY